MQFCINENPGLDAISQRARGARLLVSIPYLLPVLPRSFLSHPLSGRATASRSVTRRKSSGASCNFPRTRERRRSGQGLLTRRERLALLGSPLDHEIHRQRIPVPSTPVSRFLSPRFASAPTPVTPFHRTISRNFSEFTIDHFSRYPSVSNSGFHLSDLKFSGSWRKTPDRILPSGVFVANPSGVFETLWHTLLIGLPANFRMASRLCKWREHTKESKDGSSLRIWGHG